MTAVVCTKTGYNKLRIRAETKEFRFKAAGNDSFSLFILNQIYPRAKIEPERMIVSGPVWTNVVQLEAQYTRFSHSAGGRFILWF